MNNEEIVREHVRALSVRDRVSLVDAYADDAVFLIPADPIMGKEAIRIMFDGVPDDALPTDISFDSIWSRGEYAFATYRHLTAGEAIGITFHIRDGKILMQSAHVVRPKDFLPSP